MDIPNTRIEESTTAIRLRMEGLTCIAVVIFIEMYAFVNPMEEMRNFLATQ
jgi:hypothetical protein